VAFYLPNANMDVSCKMDCGHVGRQTWGSYFGTDGLIYASDLELGFFIVDPAGSRAGVPYRAATFATPRGVARGTTFARGLRVVRAGSGYLISFAAGWGVPVHAAVYDVNGRRVASLGDGGPHSGSHTSAAGHRTLGWNGRDDSGVPLACGVYLVRAEVGGGVASAKLVHLGQ